MAEDPIPRQLRLEAERARMSDERLGITSTPKVGNRILQQPREAYRPPSFLGKIAPPEEVAELAEILGELWEVNQEHVGDPTLEVEAYYVLTGQRHDLTERLIAWCRRIFERRSDPGRINPRDQGDPFIRFERLREDFDRILGRVSNMDGTVNYIFIDECSAFVTWYLFDRTWGRFVEVGPDGCLSLTFKPSRADIPVRCAVFLKNYRLLLRDLGLFLRKVRGAARCRDRLDTIRGLPDDALRPWLDGLMADIQEMRPFLLRGFHPERASISLGDDLVVAWDWSLRYGLASLITGTTVEDIQRIMVTRIMELGVTVGRDGLLLDANNPWVTTETIAAREGDRWLPENGLVLELFHEKLLELYYRIDFERIRRHTGHADIEDDLDDEVLALSIQDLAARDREVGADELRSESAPVAGCLPPARHIRPLRSLRLLKFLSDRFGCEVRQGKGSEITVYREGGRIFTLGRHKRNDEVHSIVVKMLLKRLGIGRVEWLQAVND